jgi:hypothetical protein
LTVNIKYITNEVLRLRMGYNVSEQQTAIYITFTATEYSLLVLLLVYYSLLKQIKLVQRITRYIAEVGVKVYILQYFERQRLGGRHQLSENGCKPGSNYPGNSELYGKQLGSRALT